MTRTPMLILIVAAAALAGCNKESHTIVAGPDVDNDTNAVASNGPVALPPSISASKTYRCADNTIVDIDWRSDGTAHVKKKGQEEPTVITAGSSDLKGDAKAKSVSYKGQNCNS